MKTLGEESTNDLGEIIDLVQQWMYENLTDEQHEYKDIRSIVHNAFVAGMETVEGVKSWHPRPLRQGRWNDTEEGDGTQ